MTDQWFGKTMRGNDAGIVKLLDMGKADVGCCAGIADSNKIDVVDFVVPTYPLRYQQKRLYKRYKVLKKLL